MNVMSIEESAFPRFDQEQMEMVAKIGDLVSFPTNKELITQGQKDYSFFVTKSGKVRVAEKCDSGENLITTLGPLNFTGDVDMLTQRFAVTSTITNEPVEAYCLCGGRLRRLLGEYPKTSDIDIACSANDLVHFKTVATIESSKFDNFQFAEPRFCNCPISFVQLGY